MSNIYDAIHAHAVLDAMAMALSNLNVALAGLLDASATKRGRPASPLPIFSHGCVRYYIAGGHDGRC